MDVSNMIIGVASERRNENGNIAEGRNKTTD